MGKVVGIDLGTTNSVVAVIEGGKPVVIANAEGMRTTPSVVAFSKEGERLVGQMARRQAVLNPQNTFYGVKRFMGRKYAELSAESKQVPYTIRRDEGGGVRVRCPRLEKDFAPEEVSAMILRKLADEASRYLGQPVSGAVITVPAYFDDAQRQATRDAGRIAGLDVKRILNEPTSAALAYGLDQQFSQTILVFDLGGGTFDVSLLEVGDGVFEVKATSGDTQLGGTNFDQKIVNWLAEQFLEAEGIDLRRDRQALQRLTEAAEKAKIELSGVAVTEINLPFITATKDGPKHLETRLERSQFEALCGDLLSRLRGPLKRAFMDAGLTPAQIDEVVLVGGASRMPMVQNLVRTLIKREPNQNVNPDEVVAVGAAIQAGILTQEVQDILLLDVTPLSLGLETIGGVMKKLIPRNTTIPVRRSDIFSTSESNQTVVEVHVLQGEREMAADNKSLGRFKLMGIPPAPRGVPQVLVSLDIDANGILQVSALDKTTGREQSITVQGASNLDDFEVERMIQEAEEYADDDRLQRERVEKRNRAEALTFQAERVLREVALDFGMQFARDRRRRIETLIQELRDYLDQSDERGIDITQADLQDEIYELNREAYLYDEDDEEEDLFKQIGSSIKRTFSGDRDRDFADDYSYGGSAYGGSSYGGSAYGNSRWEDDDWGLGDRNRNRPSEPYDRRYENRQPPYRDAPNPYNDRQPPYRDTPNPYNDRQPPYRDAPNPYDDRPRYDSPRYGDRPSYDDRPTYDNRPVYDNRSAYDDRPASRDRPDYPDYNRPNYNGRDDYGERDSQSPDPEGYRRLPSEDNESYKMPERLRDDTGRDPYSSPERPRDRSGNDPYAPPERRDRPDRNAQDYPPPRRPTRDGTRDDDRGQGRDGQYRDAFDNNEDWGDDDEFW
ncbi:MAG: molecular chaperone DnaK [Cyanobacteria bacterium P01_A01_bin.123]